LQKCFSRFEKVFGELKGAIELKSIKYSNASTGNNSDKCKTLEYSFGDKEIDLGVATITGRYPEKGYCMNLVSKELVYVIEGNGTIYFENKKVDFSKGDAILIEPKEKYYWKSDYCVVSMTCTPAWSLEQYKTVEE